MGIKYFVALFFSLQLTTLAANAAEEEPVIESESSEEELSQTSSNSQDEEASEPVEDRFIPSTQISEDLSVSFPVDI